MDPQHSVTLGTNTNVSTEDRETWLSGVCRASQPGLLGEPQVSERKVQVEAGKVPAHGKKQVGLSS